MPIKLDKIIFFCTDVLRLVEFYKSNFGFQVVGEADMHWTVLNAGTIEIAFHRIGDQYLSESAEPMGENSNVKLVFDLDIDLIQFRKNLLDKKIALGEIKKFDGVNYIVCDGQDPEGNVFQLMQTVE